jgi:hypothetical protein
MEPIALRPLARRLLLILTLAALAAFALHQHASAHHGWSGYESSTLVSLTGPIKSASYGNPHGTLTLTAEGKEWLVILAPPFRMDSRGLKREMLMQGKKVTVEGYASRRDPQELRAERITVDGKTVELR